MKKIRAKVNTRLLAKADRLFTGTVEGRVIEILQNALRAGATKVGITNEGGFVTVQDNGRGIEDFGKLLDLGGSGWDGTFEQSEDPAGVGLFCLSGREVTIRSKGKRVTIDKDGWLGKPVAVLDDSEVKVDVATGKEIGEACLGCGRLICVESLTITARTTDGKVHSSPVCLAVTEPTKEERRWFDSARVYVTREARKRLYASDIWFHLGGYWEDGDTYDTQATLFSNELDEFWLSIDGPNEPFRAALVESLDCLAPGWQSVSATADGVVRVVLADGSQKTIEPPRVTVSETG